MAIKIRCQDCKKKISIDEAFAGGMCRCPYCKALVFVEAAAGPGRTGARPGAPAARPDAPTRRPDAPAPAGAPAPAAAGEHAAADADHIPMANPVKVQGIITIIILALLVLMVVGGIVGAVMFIPGKPKGPPPDENTAPPKVGVVVADKGPAVADINIEAPVVYVLDGGSSMRSVFDGAKATMLESIKTLKSGKFCVIVACEDEDKEVLPEMPTGSEGASKVLDALPLTAGGASDLSRAIKAALAKKPKTIVLFAQKPVDDAKALAQQAKSQNTVIDAICIKGDSDAAATLQTLAQGAGGQMRNLRP